MLNLLKKIWYWPEQLHWMHPLPLFHRRGLLISAALIMLALLWPYSPDDRVATGRNAENQAGPGDVMQAELADTDTAGHSAPPAADEVRKYRIVEGQTLAQLFRQHNLPVADVFAMAQAEGDDKPLSNLHAGQQVVIDLNAQGLVASLEIEVSPTASIKFIRQPDGAYLRR
ncbi:OapA family protein [Martelella alba]|nr:LysM-like peptidoglycan-binding domain-containing protein [Martelella alba]